jgi:hypothetical protein
MTNIALQNEHRAQTPRLRALVYSTANKKYNGMKDMPWETEADRNQ